MDQPRKPKSWRDSLKKGVAYSLIVSVYATSSPVALAALSDLADVPLASSSTTVVKPNVLFTLDDSGSMGWDYMPDDISNWEDYVGFKNYRCNLIYYNPNITYVPPKNPDGTDFANQTFTAAKNDGFDSGSSTANLSTSFRAHSNDSSQPAYYYRLKTGQAAIAPPPADSRCRESSSSSFPHSSSSFDKVQVSATSGPGGIDERTNFANWYSFYRIRLNMMKSAAGRAFVTLNSSYRVGFITINPNNPVSSSKYLPIADFDVTQKANWFAKLYSQGTNGSTPLREALSRAGRHFAGLQTGINNGMTGDPIQYSCQQNFTLLTSDGYWNSNAGDKLDGSTIDNHDGDPNAMSSVAPTFQVSPRPIFDGTVAITTTTKDVVTEFYSTSGCNGGRTRIRATRDRTATTVDAFGNTTTSTSSSTINVQNCSRNPDPLQSPNPQTTTTVTTGTTGGSSGSLADVAQYYYITDLRPNGSTGALGLDVGTDNNVPKTGTGPEDDKAPHQHMTTFTMGLGLSGTLAYDPNYRTQITGDFADLRTGVKNWPSPSQNDPTALDDLWHAAVNGRGQFFSASNADSVVQSLTAALSGVSARVASAAAAATSNLEPVAGDNFAYTASYTTQQWTGELEAKEIDLLTGTVGTTPVWSSQAKLNAKGKALCDTRTIKLFRSGATNNLVDFKWNTDSCDVSGNPVGSPVTTLNASEQAYFGASQMATLSQYPSMTDGTSGTVNQRALAVGAPIVNFIRGQRGNEGFVANSNNEFFRARAAILGDIVNAQPVFIKAPFATYDDLAGNTGYSTFKAANASRTPMLYVAANGGMLHAFYAGSSVSDPQGGEERWAFIPSMVLPNLYKLTDSNYANLHQYYVDGTPTASDVYDSVAGVWKTILVGGLNRGGKGYYALDVTDPANPKALWEFKHGAACSPVAPTSATLTNSDCHLGYSYGNPVISKLADNRWVVFVSSGYNNVNSPTVSGDGEGYLYVLDAITGNMLWKISTHTGTPGNPSGLGKINNYVNDTTVDNRTVRVYGVDLQGNIWRFEVNGTPSATLLGTAKDASNQPQSITTRPFLAEVGSPPSPFVFVGTGRYLGSTDLSDTQTQSVYAIKDPLGGTPAAPSSVTPVIPDLRSPGRQMRITTTGTTRSITCTANCSSTDGWYTDLPDSGERVNVDIKLELGTLTVASNVPTSNACNIGGYSWINFFNSQNGDVVPGAANLGTKLSDSLAVGLNIVRLPDGRVVVISTTSDSAQVTREAPIAAGAPTGKRISWREILQ